MRRSKFWGDQNFVEANILRRLNIFGEFQISGGQNFWEVKILGMSNLKILKSKILGIVKILGRLNF